MTRAPSVGRLSPAQRRALAAIDHDAASQGRISVPRLAAIMDTSPHGAAATASSLVRRGVLVRHHVDGKVLYGRR